MKYLVPGKRLAALEEQEFDLLVAVNVGDKSLVKETWGTGWIFEATESFNLFCMIKFGWEPIELQEEEFEQIMRHGVSFLSKERGRNLNKRFVSLYPTNKS